MTIESVPYHHYEIKKRHDSELGLPIDVIETVAFKCPRCGTHNAPLNHGQVGQCQGCGLHFQLWGNDLSCSDKSFTEGNTNVLDNFTEHARPFPAGDDWPRSCGDEVE